MVSETENMIKTKRQEVNLPAERDREGCKGDETEKT